MGKNIATLLVLGFLAASSLGAILPVRATADSWVLKSPMPKPEEYVKAAVVEDKIYTFGGTDYATQVYDPKTDTWTIKTSMPNPATGFAVAAYQGKIYVIGGLVREYQFMSIGVNRVYDPSNDIWETKTPMPMGLSYVCANVVNDKIYVMGGLLNEFYSRSASNRTLVYDPVLDKWSEASSMPTGVVDYASAIVDSKIYIMGGVPDVFTGLPQSVQHFNQIYDTATDKWTFGADPPIMGGTAGATTGLMAPKRIYLFGGGSSIAIGGRNISPFQTCQMYDPQTDIWVNCADMMGGRVGLAVAVVNDELYAIGGTEGWNEGYGNAYGRGDYRQGQGFVPSAKNALYTPFGYGKTPDDMKPEIVVLSPEDKTYSEGYVALVFWVNKPTAWLAYSFDGEKNAGIFGNITLIYNYTLFNKRFPNHNTTIIYGLHNETFPDTIPLYGVKNGFHNITVTVVDAYGNTCISETINFSINNEPKPEPFPTTLVVAASGALLAVIGVCLLVYFKKRKH